jgi:N-formylglutamate amidohydrolase
VAIVDPTQKISMTSITRRYSAVGICLVALAMLPPLLAQAPPEAEKLVTVRTGTLPIIVSAPHGGRKAIPGVKERKGNGVTQFVTVRDEYTAELAEKLAAALEKTVGGKPYVVIARFERKYIDVNRPAKDAYESDSAKPYYDTYHAAMRHACKDVQDKWRGGLLLDIHGQAAETGTIFRGTNAGKTVTHLTDRFGKPALTGPKSVLGVLAKKGYLINPTNDSTDKEDRRFGGGYTVQTYGSKDGGTIDAIQFELGLKLRQPKNADQTAKDIADAVAVFAKEYLPTEPLKKP